jgi:hypothetical protein
MRYCRILKEIAQLPTTFSRDGRYCEFDTMSMVLVLDHWRRCVGLA